MMLEKKHEEWQTCDNKTKSLMLMYIQFNQGLRKLWKCKEILGCAQKKYDAVSDVNV